MNRQSDEIDMLYHQARQAARKELPIITLQNVDSISQQQLNRAAAGAWADGKNGRVTIHFDTLCSSDNTVVEGRMFVNPAGVNIEDGLTPAVYTRTKKTAVPGHCLKRSLIIRTLR